MGLTAFVPSAFSMAASSNEPLLPSNCAANLIFGVAASAFPRWSRALAATLAADAAAADAVLSASAASSNRCCCAFAFSSFVVAWQKAVGVIEVFKCDKLCLKGGKTDLVKSLFPPSDALSHLQLLVAFSISIHGIQRTGCLERGELQKNLVMVLLCSHEIFCCSLVLPLEGSDGSRFCPSGLDGWGRRSGGKRIEGVLEPLVSLTQTRDLLAPGL
mmetsp:Transcript_49476/g.99216  ORF Transcript_49476/g.99216 Transcript_49476/m.99216 type:complete len:216 (-) Transcript_49476:267-914(-)